MTKQRLATRIARAAWLAIRRSKHFGCGSLWGSIMDQGVRFQVAERTGNVTRALPGKARLLQAAFHILVYADPYPKCFDRKRRPCPIPRA